jgi:hypothetical protein
MMKAFTDEVVFDVTGATSVVIYRRLYSKYGMVDVYVDSKYHSSFDNYTSSPATGTFLQPYMIAGLDPGFNHHIRLVAKPIGKKLNQFKPFDIDKIEVRDNDQAGIDFLEDGRYENNDATALSGGAISYEGSGWSHGTISTASIKGSKAQVVFYGNIFRVYFNQVSGGGKADIYVDGKRYGTYNTGTSVGATDVPFTVINLPEKMHTAQVVAQGPKVNINAFEVLSLLPYAEGTYDLAPSYNPYVLRSGAWTLSGESLITKDQNASLYLYVHGGNTLTITYDTPDNSGDIEVYINGVLHSTIDAPYTKSLTGTQADYIVSSLGKPLVDGGWIEIRNPKPKSIGLRSLTVGSMGSPLGPDDIVQAEGTDKIKTAGWWVTKPTKADVRYKGSFFTETKNRFAHFYIPVQNVNYVTIYRPLTGGYNDAKVYIDGELWGTMPMTSSKLQYSAAFSIGPIPNPSDLHVIELRSSAKKNFALDQIESKGLETIGPGYYENDYVTFAGSTTPPIKPSAYTGTWKIITDPLASGTTLHQTTSRGARLVTTFQGNEITIFRRTSSLGKTMIAYVDGTPYQINNYSKVTTQRVPHTILLPNPGPHSFELVADAGQLNLDAIEVKNAVETYEGAYQHNSMYMVLNNTWTPVTSTAHSGGSYATTTTKYASSFFLFYGSQVTVYSTSGRSFGLISVYLDGKYLGDINQYLYDKVLHPANEAYYVYDIPGLNEDKHVLELRFMGKKDKKATGTPTINFDVITVDGYPAPLPGEVVKPEEPGDVGGGEVPTTGCYEDNLNNWTYVGPDGTWATYGSGAASGGTYHQGGTGASSGDNVYAEFAFKASGFTLVYVKQRGGGFAEIFVDGVLRGSIDMYDADSVWWTNGIAVQYTITGLNPAANHILRVKWTNTAPPKPYGDTRIYIDRIHFPSYTETCTPGP